MKEIRMDVLSDEELQERIDALEQKRRDAHARARAAVEREVKVLGEDEELREQLASLEQKRRSAKAK